MSSVLLQSEQMLAMAEAHRLEVLLLETQIERLRALVREHGIPLPAEDSRLGASDGEHLLACRNVVDAAYALLARLDELRDLVGSGMELVNGEPWRE